MVWCRINIIMLTLSYDARIKHYSVDVHFILIDTRHLYTLVNGK